MSDELEVEWEPEPVKADVESLKKHASPFREDLKAKERREKCIPARSRRFECPNCGILKNVDPLYTGTEWHYWGLCSHCGVRWCNAYYILIKCEECGKKVPVTSKNPDGKCKCQGTVSRPF